MADQYRQAGVDIDAGEEAVRRIARHVESTRTPGVLGRFGGFGGLFDPRAAGVGPDELLVSGTDGVGTKLKLAFATGVHETIGIDCVAMCVNDVLTIGARPLFFLDYLAVGRLEPGIAEQIVAGVAVGCRQAGCALIGGETAEMPGFYPPGEFDLAGFVVGAVPRDRVLDGSRIAAGHQLIGVASTGFHSNGFSLIRNVLLERAKLSLNAIPSSLDATLGEVLLRPTRIYVREIQALLAAGLAIDGLVHVTGGGLIDNLPRILPDGLAAELDPKALAPFRHPELDLVQSLGDIDEHEMFRVFNMGVGLVIVTSDPTEILRRLGDDAAVIGKVVDAPTGPRVLGV